MSSSNSSSAVRSSAKHAAERIQQHLPPNSNHAVSLSSSSLNLPARTSIVAPGIAHSSRLKDRPSASSSSSSSSVSASSPSTRRSGTPVRRSQSKDFDDDNDPGRVRVSVRVRPRNGEELISDADFADLVELQPEIKRLKLRKNNWNSESYKFDEVFTDTASQKRVYEGVAKPVVEGVLSGYNGTIMAYGQTGTGKTYTVGKIGKDDAAERGIMVRALEDILLNASSASISVEISYLQLYMETIQDLLAPEKNNISINEDAKTGEVSVPGATVVNIQDLDHFLQVLQVGETNRHAANTKMNTESSRSHAILTVYVRRAMNEKTEKAKPESLGDKAIPRVRKSKLLIVDLAGSERINKSGTDGHMIEEAKFINLSLTSLGKCINALAEGSSHIPTRDSKLTRLLRDSFGGSARTSLIITIGPSARYHAETTSTIMFGQRAMKIVNMVKLKEEFDYESLCRKLETQVDHLTAEVERQNKLRNSEKHELEKRLRECENSFAEAEKNAVTRSKFLEKENTRLELSMKELLKDLQLQKDQCDLMHDKAIQLEMKLKNTKQQLENSAYEAKLADTSQVYEKKIAELVQRVEDEQARSTNAEHQLTEMKNILSKQQKSIHEQEKGNYQYQRELAETTHTYESKIAELQKKLEGENARSNAAEDQLRQMKRLISDRQVISQENEEANELKIKLEELSQMYESTVDELQTVKLDYDDLLQQKEKLGEEVRDMKERLLLEEKQRKQMESELSKLKKNLRESENVVEEKRYMKEDLSKGSAESGAQTGSQRSQGLKKSLSGQRATMARLCEEVGIQKILQLIKSEDLEVQIQAVKVVANLAAEEANQVKIVEEGGVEALLMLVQSSQNSTILRVASGAIANLAMNEKSQDLIMNKGGAQLLAKMVTKTDDPQTLRMVAGALANLCGNGKHKIKNFASDDFQYSLYNLCVKIY
ncbi:Armadillo/beta-catenin repeat family protein / kinesin motor family protein [Arabidopsis thaliana]|uniref:Kinesin-like protein n=1 Tax=Arabidopsis thaliana TaxID=3702 RepID=A0A1I9LP88_ARATH|nr:Armadillo/beta-catenin repeat family protein / kinesin motor family protein [Arabidopsis thaliana]ANM64396.1 Armadillo/beta-catenin repeat family protein / kinesin motor family protein [Arabidopsis thaliana]|eukprot:NP_001326427.1 Armadillo/beta-catenin repeat family protein / kinesin motor family protein [Arabidopsis thaliana]